LSTIKTVVGEDVPREIVDEIAAEMHDLAAFGHLR
jgi:hypothetical protein